MRILYFSSRECWPTNTGARLRDWHLATQLARNAEVVYVGLRNPKDPPPETPANSPLAAMKLLEKPSGYSPLNLVRGLIGPTPVTLLNNYSAQLIAGLRPLFQGSFDSIQMEGVHLLPLLPLLRESLPGVPVICDWHNIESELMRRYAETTPSLPRRLYAHRTASLIEKAEARLLISCEAHTVCSAREQATLAPAAQGRPVEVIGNGVDVEAFTRQPSSAPRTRILYVGSMDYHANIDAVTWFAREVWPLFLGACHAPDDSKFTIVGRSPSPEVEALASLDRIEVTGTVPEVAPFYDQARAVVVPLRVGGGTRLKILEAMAAGVPVISTTLGAEGLDATAGTHYLRADTPQEFLQALAALTHERAASIASAARTLVEQQYDWPAIGDRLFDLHRRVAATSKR